MRNDRGVDISVIYKDKNIVVINKPSGVLVHGVPGKSREETLADWILEHYPETRTVGDDPVSRPGIVHRLDKETSGVLVIARNQETFEYLKKLFQGRLIRKKYLALVWGKMKVREGVIDKPIGITTGTTKRSVASTKMQKEAVTLFKVKRTVRIGMQDYTLLEVEPKTGRTHQIRVHLASLGHPVVGDRLYGGSRSRFEGLRRHFLHAESIEFTLPSGERVTFEAELPQELRAILL